MTDTALNRFLSTGTHAQRLAFVPNPAVPASGPNQAYFWFETDTGNAFVWDTAALVWDQITAAGGITQLTGDVTAGPGAGSQAATIAANAVTLAKIQNAAANSKLIGSGAAGAGAAYSEITLGTGLSMTGNTLNAAAAGGGSNYKGFSPLALHTVGTAFSAGNWGGVGVVMDEACTLNSIAFVATAASATSQVQAAIYSDNGTTVTTLLASSGVVTGVTKGLNVINLSIPLAVTQGTFYWIGMVVEVANIAIANNQGIAAAFFATAGPAPGTAPAATFGNHPEIAVWGSK